jgi:hypothetical protein
MLKVKACLVVPLLYSYGNQVVYVFHLIGSNAKVEFKQL